MYRILLSGLLSYLIPTILIAQAGLVENQVPSPNATSFMKYIDNPVSLHSGTAQIEIPVFDVKSGSLSLPISLSYHASGIKPDEFPSWVGMGWALNAGGVITRKVNNFPDDLYLDMPGYEQYLGMYKCDEPGDPSHWENFRSNSLGYDYQDLPKDLATDEYYFSFGNYSGKFVLSNDWDYDKQCWRFTAIGHPELKIEACGVLDIIEFPVPCQFKGDSDFQFKNFYKGFRITTPDGFRYDFGCHFENPTAGIGAVDLSVPYFSNDFWVDANIESWHLVRISKVNSNESITLEYSRKEPMLNLFESCKFEASQNDYDILGNYGHKLFKFLQAGYESSRLYAEHGFVTYDIIGRIVSSVYLSEISFNNGSVDFIMDEADDLGYNPELLESAYKLNVRAFGGNSCLINGFYLTNRHVQKLNKIVVKNTQGSVKRVFNFAYCDSVDQRLRLLKFWEDDLNPYIFSYIGHELKLETDIYWPYNEDIPELPSYLSQKTDHKGYLTDGSGEKYFLVNILRNNSRGPYNNCEGRVFYPIMHDKNTSINTGTVLIHDDTGDSRNGNKEYWIGYFSNNFQEINYDNSALSGTLGKIEYPTGGYKYYTYEPNYADSIVLSRGAVLKDEDTIISYNNNAGGIRIKNISTYDLNGIKILSDSYQYELGILNGLPGFYDISVLPITEGPGGQIFIHSFSSDNQNPLSSTNTASPVVYSKVINITEGLDDTYSTNYYFRNFQDHPHLYTPQQIIDKEDLHLDSPSMLLGNTTMGKLLTGREYNRGQTIAIVYLDQDDEIVKKEYFEYRELFDIDSIQLFNNIIVTNSLALQKDGKTGPIYVYERSEIWPNRLDVSRKTIINYFDQDSIKEEKEFDYDQFWGLPIKEKYYCNGEPVYETWYNRIHNGICGGTGLPEELRITQQMYYKNLLELPVEIKYYRYNNNNRYLVSGEYFEYGNFGSIGNTDSLYYPKAKYTLNLVEPVYPTQYSDTSFFEYFNNNESLFPGLEKEIDYLNYDNKGNYLETNKKGTTYSAKYSYNSSLPVIQAVNIGFNELETSIDRTSSPLTLDNLLAYSYSSNSPQDSLNSFSVKLAQDTLMKNAGFIFQTFDPLIGMKSQTDPNGNTTIFQYDNKGRLEKVFDNNHSLLKQYTYNYHNSFPDGSVNITGSITGSMPNNSLPKAVYTLNAALNPSFPVRNYSWSITNGQIIGASNEPSCKVEVGCSGQTTVSCEIKLLNDSIVTVSKITDIDMNFAMIGDTITSVNSVFGYQTNGKNLGSVTFHWSIDDGTILEADTLNTAFFKMPGDCTTTTVRCTVNYCESSLVLSKQLVVKRSAYYVNSQSISILDDTTNYFVHFLVNEPTGTVYQWNVDGPASIIGSSTDSVANINFYDLGYAEVSCIVNQQGCDPDTTSFVEKIDIEGYFVSLPGISLYTHHWENDPSEVRWKIYEMQQDSTYSQISDYLITQTRGDCSGTYDWYGIYDWSCQSCGEFETDGKLFYYNLGEDPCISFTNNHQYRVECIITVNSSPIYTCPVEFIYNNSQFIEQIP
jgi:hypothetical protein